jgi:hypothetical protein
MVHHPWVELYRMRRSMRQINLLAGAPTDSSSAFSSSQVAAAAAAAGAALMVTSHSTACLSHLAPPPALVASDGSSSGNDSSGGGGSSGAGQGAMWAAAAALTAVKNNLKQSVASKLIASGHALQGGSKAADAHLGSKADLHSQLAAASSPCLLQQPGASPLRTHANLLKAAVAGSMAAAPAPAPAQHGVAPSSPPAAPGTPAPGVMPLPGILHKGGSLKLDADAHTFLFASAFKSSRAPPPPPQHQQQQAHAPGGLHVAAAKLHPQANTSHALPCSVRAAAQ